MAIEQSESDSTELLNKILHYLQINPNAAESLKEIVTWWLPHAYKWLCRN